MRGQTKSVTNGIKKLELDDLYDVYKKVKGSPKFWQVGKCDLVAKVRQLGPFHIFYTFSCGEMRWTVVFLSLFKQKGYRVEYPKDWEGDDDDIFVEGMPLWTYVNDVMSQKKHELFKDYTFLITRLFDARVKSFIFNILMAGGKDKIPFQYYSYRVEFQARGMVCFEIFIQYAIKTKIFLQYFKDFWKFKFFLEHQLKTIFSFISAPHSWSCLDLSRIPY